MAKALNAPDPEYLLALRSEVESQFSDDDTQIDRGRVARELKNKIPMADQWRQFAIDVRDPTYTDEIGRTVAELTINPPTLTVTPSQPSEKGQENATERELWTQGILDQAGRRIPGLDTFAAVTDSQVGDGGGWCSFLDSRDLWDVRYALKPGAFTDDAPEMDDSGQITKRGRSGASKYLQATEEAKKMAGSPYVWRAADVRSLYPIWRGVKLAEVLEIEKRSWASTFRQYRLSVDRDGNIVPEELGVGRNVAQSVSGNTVDFFRHFDDTYCTYLVAGKNLEGDNTYAIARDRRGNNMQWKHKYERPPYFYAPGLLQNQWHGRKVGWGVAESMRNLVELKSWLLTALSQGVGRDLNTSFFRTRTEQSIALRGDDGSPKGKEAYEANMIYDAMVGETIQPFPHPPVSDSLLKMLETVDKLIANLSSPQVNSLNGLEGAGFAINQVLSFAKVKFSPLAQSLERMLTEITEFMWFLTRNKIRERIWIYSRSDKGTGWRSMAPEDLADTVQIEWTINPEQPSDKLILNRYLTERQKSGSLGLDEVIERLGDNPDEIRRSRARDQIRQSPEYQKLLQGQVLQGIGRGDLLEQAAQANQVAQTGIIPPQPGQQGLPITGPGPTAGMPMIPTQSGASTAMQAVQG